MSDTETRPTPEEIIAPLEYTPGTVESHLSRHGYRIVHPDDVRIDASLADTEYGRGFTDCRDFIFGGDDE